MKDKKHIKSFNEATETWISDVSRSFIMNDLKNACISALKANEDYMEPIIQGSYPVDHKRKTFEEWYKENYD